MHPCAPHTPESLTSSRSYRPSLHVRSTRYPATLERFRGKPSSSPSPAIPFQTGEQLAGTTFTPETDLAQRSDRIQLILPLRAPTTRDGLGKESARILLVQNKLAPGGQFAQQHATRRNIGREIPQRFQAALGVRVPPLAFSQGQLGARFGVSTDCPPFVPVLVDATRLRPDLAWSGPRAVVRSTFQKFWSDFAPDATTGTATSNVVPMPWVLRTETEPPRRLQKRLTVNKPRPVPRGATWRASGSR